MNFGNVIRMNGIVLKRWRLLRMIFVKMAHLAIVGSHSVNGVAKIHTEILKQREMRLFYEFYPDKFNNKTNGIAHRRWLMKANPQLTNLISEAIGTEWKKEPIKLQELQLVQYDASFQEKFAEVKQERKEILAERIHHTMGITIDIILFLMCK